MTQTLLARLNGLEVFYTPHCVEEPVLVPAVPGLNGGRPFVVAKDAAQIEAYLERHTKQPCSHKLPNGDSATRLVAMGYDHTMYDVCTLCNRALKESDYDEAA